MPLEVGAVCDARGMQVKPSESLWMSCGVKASRPGVEGFCLEGSTLRAGQDALGKVK